MADHFEEHKKALRKEPEVSGTSSSMDPSNMTKSSYCSVVRSSVEAPLSVTHSTGPESSVPSPPERRFANSSPDLESSSTALLDFGHTNGAQPPTLSLSALAGNASILAADTRPQDDEVCSNASTSSDASSIPSAHIADASASTLGDRLKGAFSEQEKSDSMSQSYNRPCSPQTQLGIADSRVPPDLVISRAEVSRGARSSARRETSRLFNPDPVPNARQQLLDARVPNEGRFFIPIDSINSIITKEMVTFQLKAQRDWMHRGRETSIGTMVEDCAPKLFGVLTIICNPGTIVDFLSNGITDRALPLSGSNLSHLTRIPFPRWTSINGYETPPSARWTSWEVEEFCRVQWWFLAPVFEFNPSCRVDHYELEDERVLPYMNSDDKASKVEGGFSEVWPVRIHPSHQRALKPQDDIYPLVAVKRLHSTNKDAFQAEVENLKAFNENKNEHIIELLATYQHQGRYHLVFPYADYNLRSHWKRTPRPWLTPDITLWTVEQMLGLTGAIACIHSSSFVRKPSTTSASHGLLQVDTKEERFGRHGDIKPENILWSNDVNGDEKGMLKITDFGLSQRHSQDSRSRVDPTTIGCSPTYAPPELALQQPVSRSYDIWSLGCVFVECITWLLAGADAIVDFALARGLKNGKAGVDENTFYQLKALRRTPGPIAVVKDSVISWIQQLRENSRCSALVHDLLDLVQFRVLVVEPALRITAQTLAKSLHDMLARGKVDVSYMLTPAPGFSLQNVRPEKRTLCTDPSDTLLEDSAKRQKLPNPL
ncbi:uncharacterized protein PAC_12978 [Phialocephala subalpina]|uniref:Protein kinase domain-containing protein n=1 Tax=Phialocephala subalpina TaxID=576137 RepID=A0A1L7XDI3_9HELO|nr:uncharacterized protein PAC_12978 [Phialocephala subalpina]